MHTHEQYDLSVYEGAVRWIHHNEYDQQIFSVKTEPIIVKGMGTYLRKDFSVEKHYQK